MNEFETNYKKIRHEFKSKIYSFVIVEGVECFYEAYDKGANNCFYEFSKYDLCHIDDGEASENSCYDDMLEHLRYSRIGDTCFKKLSISFSKTVEELVLMFYNSIQDYFDYKTICNSIFPKHYDFCNANVSHCLYYSTEYDDYYDDENGFYDFAETIQNDRAEFFFSRCNNLRRINGVFDKFY